MTSLWVHKYRPVSLDTLDFHANLTNMMRNLASDEDFPHLLMYGPRGAGKKTRVVAILRELFGPSVLRIKVDSRQLVVNKESSRKLDVTVVSSVHHAEITPSDSGTQDRVVIQEFLKEMAQTQQVDMSAKHRFKVVVINETDRLSRDAQAALRRTMEIYSSNLRLILLANSTSSIMAPIRSRTLLVRVPAPSRDDVMRVLEHVALKQNLVLEDQNKTLSSVTAASERNLRKALLMLQALHAQAERIPASAKPPLPDWEVMIEQMATTIFQSQTASKLSEIRAQNYELLSHCVPAAVILKTLLQKLLAKVSDAKQTAELVHYAAIFDHRLKQGAKEIFHLEAFCARAMQILQG